MTSLFSQSNFVWCQLKMFRLAHYVRVYLAADELEIAPSGTVGDAKVIGFDLVLTQRLQFFL